MRYLSSRDVDVAYWALNGRKYAEGWQDADGTWVSYSAPRYDPETFGILKEDWETVRLAWRVRDLQALMSSPATWIPQDIGCKQDFLNHVCDK